MSIILIVLFCFAVFLVVLHVTVLCQTCVQLKVCIQIAFACYYPEEILLKGLSLIPQEN